MSKTLDIQQSIVAANGNVSLAKELFSMLLNDLDVRLGQIETSFHNNDLEMLSEHVHKLYGATAYCIVPKLRKSAEVLEDVLRQKEHSQLTELVNDVVDKMKEIITTGPNYLEEDWNDFQ